MKVFFGICALLSSGAAQFVDPLVGLLTPAVPPPVLYAIKGPIYVEPASLRSAFMTQTSSVREIAPQNPYAISQSQQGPPIIEMLRPQSQNRPQVVEMIPHQPSPMNSYQQQEQRDQHYIEMAQSQQGPQVVEMNPHSHSIPLIMDRPPQAPSQHEQQYLEGPSPYQVQAQHGPHYLEMKPHQIPVLSPSPYNPYASHPIQLDEGDDQILDIDFLKAVSFGQIQGDQMQDLGFGQAQEDQMQMSGYGQAQGDQMQIPGYGQAQADQLQDPEFGQAQGDQMQVLGYGQAQGRQAQIPFEQSPFENSEFGQIQNDQAQFFGRGQIQSNQRQVPIPSERKFSKSVSDDVKRNQLKDVTKSALDPATLQKRSGKTAYIRRQSPAQKKLTPEEKMALIQKRRFFQQQQGFFNDNSNPFDEMNGNFMQMQQTPIFTEDMKVAKGYVAAPNHQFDESSMLSDEVFDDEVQDDEANDSELKRLKLLEKALNRNVRRFYQNKDDRIGHLEVHQFLNIIPDDEDDGEDIVNNWEADVVDLFQEINILN